MYMHIHLNWNLDSTHEGKHTEYLFVGLTCFAQHGDSQLHSFLQRPWLHWSLQMSKIPLWTCTIFLHPFFYCWRSRLIPSPAGCDERSSRHMRVSLCWFHTLRFMPRSGAAGPFRVLGLDLEKAPSWGPQWLHHLVSPQKHKGSPLPHILPSACYCWIFNDSHSEWGEMGFQKQLKFMFPRWLKTLGTFSNIYCISVFLLLETVNSFYWPIYWLHIFWSLSFSFLFIF